MGDMRANFAREMIKTVVVGKNLGVPQVVHNKNLRYSITLSFEVYCWSRTDGEVGGGADLFGLRIHLPCRENLFPRCAGKWPLRSQRVSLTNGTGRPVDQRTGHGATENWPGHT